MIAWAVAAALAVQAQPNVTPVYAIKQSRAAFPLEEAVVVDGVYASRRAGGPPRFWVAEQRRADWDAGGWIRQHRWIDSRTCPALAATVQQLSEMLVGEEARLAAAERFGIRQIPTIPPFHASAVSVTRLPGEAPNMRDIGGPLTTWWLQSEKTLEPCWREDAPLADGRPVAPLITLEGAP